MGNWSLRWKLIAAFLGVAVLPLLLLGWWTEHTARHGMETRLASLGEATGVAVAQLADGLSEVSRQSLAQVGRRAEKLGTGGVSEVSTDLTTLSAALMQDAGEQMLTAADAALSGQVSAALVERARWMASQMAQLVRLHLIAMNVTAQDSRLGRETSEAEAALSELLAGQPAFSGLALLAPDGREMGRVGLARLNVLGAREEGRPPGLLQEAGGRDPGDGLGQIHPWVADTRWRPLLLDGQAVVASVRIAPEISPLTATLLVPVERRQGEARGVLAGILNLEILWERIAGGLVGRSGSAFLVGPDGLLVGRAGGEDGSPRAIFPPDWAAALGEETTSDRVWLEGVEVFRAHVPVSGLGWAVVVWLPVGEGLQPLDELRGIMTERTEELVGKIRRRGEGQVLAMRQEIGQAVEAEAARAGAHLELMRRAHLDAFNTVLPVDLADTADAFSTRFRRTLGLATAVLVLLAVSAGAILAARIGGRVARLAAGAEGLGAGDLTARVPVESRDELGALAARFNGMATVLEVRERQTRAQAAALAERGRELERLNAELRDASRVKSEFLANTSHELRTPLNAILGFIKLIRDGLYDSPEEEAQYLKDAHESTLHLLGLINNVLDIARIEAKEMNLTLEAVELDRAFDEARALTHVQAKQKGIALEFLCPGETPAVRADAGKLKQVLVNLIGNALKFTSAGHVRVTATPQPDRGYVAVAVADTGIGIAPEKQSRLFRPFRQADGSTTRRFGGTGLGLAISRALVELMGGKVALESAGEGQGTTVTFTLPIAHDEATRPALPPSVGPMDAARPLILVVEDDGAFARYLEALLTKSGYQCMAVGTADAGLEAALRLRPAAITVDCALPARAGARLHSGWDLIRALHADPATRGMPVLMLTGHEGCHPCRESTDGLHGGAPAPEVLQKPVEPDALLSRLASLTRTNARALRVLIADDDPRVQEFLRKLLTSDRYAVTQARTGLEVLEHLGGADNRGCDVLLLDLMMPGGSGYDVLRTIHRSGLSCQPPVLVLSNWPDPETEEDRIVLGSAPVLAVLEKSAVFQDPQLLLARLEQIQRQAAPEARAGTPRTLGGTGYAPSGGE